MTPRAFIFDCDGTLIDSMGMWLTIYPELVGRYGVHMTPEDFAATEHLAMPEEIAYYHEKLGIGESAEALIAELKDMLCEKYGHEIRVCPGVRSFLEEARAQGIPLGIATSTDEDMVRLGLAANGLDEFFSCLVTTEEAGASKEHPVFEDAMFGLAAAHKAGYHTLGVYDAHGRADRAVVRAGSSIFVDSFEQLSLGDILSFDMEADGPDAACPVTDLSGRRA